MNRVEPRHYTAKGQPEGDQQRYAYCAHIGEYPQHNRAARWLCRHHRRLPVVLRPVYAGIFLCQALQKFWGSHTSNLDLCSALGDVNRDVQKTRGRNCAEQLCHRNVV